MRASLLLLYEAPGKHDCFKPLVEHLERGHFIQIAVLNKPYLASIAEERVGAEKHRGEDPVEKSFDGVLHRPRRIIEQKPLFGYLLLAVGSDKYLKSFPSRG